MFHHARLRSQNRKKAVLANFYQTNVYGVCQAEYYMSESDDGLTTTVREPALIVVSQVIEHVWSLLRNEAQLLGRDFSLPKETLVFRKMECFRRVGLTRNHILQHG